MTLHDLHDYWFADGTGWPSEAVAKKWFMGGEEVDAHLRENFSDLLANTLAGKHADLDRLDHRAAVASVIALDQLPRNIHRGTAAAFAGDAMAQRASRVLLASARFAGLDLAQRYFVLMPLMHAEEVALQEESVRRFTELIASASPADGKMGAGLLKYAEEHRDIVLLFGRFPYRNQALGRTSTPAEEEWLATANVNYGQAPAA